MTISVLAKQKRAKRGDIVMRKETTILAATAALGGLFALSPISKAYALGYTFADINVPGSEPGSTGFLGLSLNNLGQVVGTYFDDSGNDNGFLYSGGKYVTLNAPGAIDTELFGINDLGQIVGTAAYSNGSVYNFIDTHGKFTSISDAISPLSGNAINDKDQVLGSLGFPNYGVLTPHGTVNPIDTSRAKGTVFVEGFNNLDQFTGEVFDSAGTDAFIDTNGVFTRFAPPNASFTFGQGINDLGQVVGGYFDSAGNGYTFIYTNGRFTTIQDPNASAAMGGTGPDDINDLDQIVGSYTDAAGNFHAFLATPKLLPFALAATASVPTAVPEPSIWAMMLVGLAGLGWLARLRTRNLTPA
jgi:probable HAF family extracellular repeat protein